MRSALTITILWILFLAAPALASHCTGPTTTQSEADTCAASVVACLYVDINYCSPECHTTIWIYEESNGIAGLQRGDEIVDDTCHGTIRPDTIIF